jgi:hypothetical protein
MPDFVTLTCPSCGGKLEITNDIDRFACGHCGAEHIVRRSGGTVALAPVVAGLAKVQSGVDKTASELAIVRLTAEIKQLETKLGEMKSEQNQTSGCLGCLGLSGAIMILATFSTALGGDSTSLSFLVVGLTVLAIAVIAARTQRPNPAQVEAEKALEDKRAELKRHQELVRQ